MSLGRCEGYRYVCGDPATWTVEATDERDSYLACESCCRLAMIYSEANAVDECGRPRDREYRAYTDPLYRTWHSMIQRCVNPNNRRYPSYGGRGITVCLQWRASFREFRDAVGARPSPQHSLDRIDNDGNYEPGNVRWATPTEQQQNTRRNRRLTFAGETRTVTEWARLRGLQPNVITTRLTRGWSIERALSPDKHDEHLLTFNGATRNIEEWADHVGISAGSIRHRLARGWSVERALSPDTFRDRRLVLDGISKTISEWSSELNIGPSTIRNRLHRGWSVERALTKSREESR